MSILIWCCHFLFSEISFFLIKLLSISVAFLLMSSSYSLWLPPLSWRPYFLTFYWGSKTFVQHSLLVTRINPFQKKISVFFVVWGQASFSLCWSFLHGLMCVYFLLFTTLKFWQSYPDSMFVNRLSQVYTFPFSALPIRKLLWYSPQIWAAQVLIAANDPKWLCWTNIRIFYSP